MVWIPHGAGQLFLQAARPWRERDVVCLVSGATDPHIYPLRSRLAELVRRGRLPGGTVLPHPGARLASLDACREQQRTYADWLGRSRLVLVTASRFQYGLAKYPEAALAGACLAGDIPPDFQDTLGPHVIQLSSENTDEELIASIAAALVDDAGLQEQAAAIQQAAAEHHSLDLYVKRVLAELRDLVRRGRTTFASPPSAGGTDARGGALREACLGAVTRHGAHLDPVLGEIDYREGGILPSEALLLAALCRDQQVGQVVESGRERGYSTESICRLLPEVAIASIDQTPDEATDRTLAERFCQLDLFRGDARELLPGLVRTRARGERVAVLLDGPKGPAALELVEPLLGEVAFVALHDTSRLRFSLGREEVNPIRPILERCRHEVWFSDDRAFVGSHGHLDRPAWQGLAADREAFIRHGFTLAIIKGGRWQARPSPVDERRLPYPRPLNRPLPGSSPAFPVRLRIVYDLPGWAHYHRATALARYAPDDFVVTTGSELGDEPADVVFQTCPIGADRTRERLPAGTRLVVGFNSSVRSPATAPYLDVALEHADLVVFNNRRNWLAAGAPEGAIWLANGVDLEVFGVRRSCAERRTRVVWCGSYGHSRTKGYEDLLEPLADRLREAGIDCELRLVDPHDPASVATPAVMAGWYNDATHYVCASEFEGTPNPALEAAACGCVVVSTPVGDMPDLIEHGVNGFLSERRVETLLGWLRHACQPDVYTDMAARMQPRIARRGWSEVAPHYFDLFRRILDAAPRKSVSRRGVVSGWIVDPTDPERAGAERVLVIGSEPGVAVKEVSPTAERIDLAIIEAPSADFPTAHFDTVVCRNLLDRLRNPRPLLARIRSWLKPQGRLVAEVANVRHHRHVVALLYQSWRGHWRDEPEPFRLFTRRELEKLLFRAGFEVEHCRFLPGEGHAQWEQAGRPAAVRAGALRIEGIDPAAAEEFHAEALLATARPDTRPDHGLTSIIILTHNQLEYTRLCLESIRFRTDESYELIVIDNASTDGTPDYLRSLPDVRLVANAENRGFPVGCNQGLALARGRQVLLLNNDTVVTTGWLRRLLDRLYSSPDIGLVGPVSNHVSGEQQVGADYQSLNDLDGFAWDWGRRHRGQALDADRLVGFCLLARTDVVSRIGPLDERFGVGCFEDDDYCRRALAAGFRCVIARDAFVHHFGGRTFVGAGIDFARLMRENGELYRAKWAAPAPPAVTSTVPVTPAATVDARAAEGGPGGTVVEPGFSLSRHPRGGLLLGRAARPPVSLSMIVRNNERTIRACLESIRPYVDEMVIVDTGSTDATPRIAESLGAMVYHFPWPDSFAVARNESLRHARVEWIFWMDSDDTIPPENGRRLRELALGDHDPSVLGYVVRVHCPGANDDGGTDVTVDHVKLIRNRPDLRFEGRIHEQILPAIRRAGGEVAWTDLYVVYSGYDHSPAGQAHKKERDFRLLRLEFAERPDHPFTLFNLGMTHADVGEYPEAAEWLRRSIIRSGPEESHLRKAYALLVHALARCGWMDQAVSACREGIGRFPLDDELRFRRAVLLHETGDLKGAASAYEDLLSRSEERHFTSVDLGLRGFKARHNLALVFRDMGESERELREWHAVVAEASRYRPGWRGFGDALLRSDRTDKIHAVADGLLADGPFPAEGRILKAHLALLQGDHEQARTILAEGVSDGTCDPDLLEEWCRFLVEHDGAVGALAALEKLVAVRPDDPAAWHNLGTARLAADEPEGSAEAFQRSLALRPDHPDTLAWLRQAESVRGRR